MESITGLTLPDQKGQKHVSKEFKINKYKIPFHTTKINISERRMFPIRIHEVNGMFENGVMKISDTQ
jgi:hypothetical protein